MAYKCGDCCAEAGKNHNVNCDIERCPKCKHQLLSCECDFPEITVDEKYLIDSDNIRWKRFIVVGLDEDFSAGD